MTRASALLALLCGCASLPDRRDARYMAVVLRDERPLMVAGKAARIESLPSPPQYEEKCHTDGNCDMTIRLHYPQLVHFKISEVLYGDAVPGEEVAFLYMSHLGFNMSDEMVVVLDPVAGDRWDWRVRSNSPDLVVHTLDGRKGLVVAPSEEWTRLPCSVASQAGPLKFVEKMRWKMPIVQHGLLLSDLQETLRRLSPTEADLDSGCPASD